MVRLIASAAALTVVAGMASAGMDPLPWLSFQVVDNGGGSDGFINLAGTTTYDLYWTNEGGLGTTVLLNGFNLGTAAQPDLAPYRIFHTGTAAQHTLGGNTPPSDALVGSFPLLAFDSYFAIGDVDAANISFVGGSAAFQPGEVLGTWFTQPGVSVGVGESIRFMRLTIDGDIDVENSVLQIGLTVDGVAREL